MEHPIFWAVLSIPVVSLFGYVAKFVYEDYTSPLWKLPRLQSSSWLLGDAREILGETGEYWRYTAKQLPFGIFGGRFFMAHRVILTDPKALAKVLVTNCYDYPKPDESRIFLSYILGSGGVLVSEGQEHKRQRKSLDSAFSIQRIKAVTRLFHSPACKLAEKWEELLKKEGGKDGLEKNQAVFDVMTWLSRCTLDIIGTAGFDYEFNSLENPNDELTKAYNELFTEGLKPSVFFFALNLIAMNSSIARFIAEKLYFRYRIIKNNRNLIKKVAQRLLDQKRREFKEAGDNVDEADLKKDILSVLVRDNCSEDQLTDDEIKDQCLTFLAAGHETTATALTWSLLRLAENPSIQDKLREEILKHFGGRLEEPLEYEELNSLPYLNAFTREVLRLDHPVPFTVRKAAKDDVLCGYQIPKGSEIIIAAAVVQHLPEIWGPDAETFDPSRFLEEGRIPDQAKGPFANLTFLAGPRNCIGTKFALTEMKSILIQIVSRFRFELADSKRVEKRTGIVMHPKEKMLNLKVTLID